MKQVNKYLRKSVWTGLLLVVIAAATLEATGLIQYYFSRKMLTEEARQRAESEMALARQKIESVMTTVETATENLSWTAGLILESPEYFFIPIRRMMETNDIIMDAALAFTDGFYPERGKWFEPLVARRGEGFEEMVLGSESHDYMTAEWFTKPILTGKGSWSEPYFDDIAGMTTVITYSVPLKDTTGAIVGVAAADITMEWLNALMGQIQLYPDSYGTIVNGNGTLLASPPETLKIANPLRYTSSVGDTGWSMSVVIPEESVFGGMKHINTLVLLLQLLGLAMIFLILRSAAKSQIRYQELNEKKQVMESELHIAHGIQMAMLPNIFPPFPERNDIDMFAFLDPAKEVGGDLYDFFIRNDKLYFCIGDVSGKGVPASLVMAVTRSLFRTVSAHERSPLHIVTNMNDSMSDTNEDTMFVTFFCGILDLLNGHLRYCNAGHNGPLLLGDTVRNLPVEPNIPLGIVSGAAFKEQEADLAYGEGIFLYTDGITEAEDKNHNMFGEERVKSVLAGGNGMAKDKLAKLKKAISAFVGGAVQSDDMTTVLIRYMNDRNPDTMERHLILHNDIQQIPQLAGFVEAIAQEKHLDQSLAMSLNLALEEVVTNVIMYAYPEGADGLVDIEAIIRKESIDFLVIDSGTPFDPTTVPAANIDAPAEDRPIGGLGIYLVKSIMDTVEYKRYEGKNILSMTKKI